MKIFLDARLDLIQHLVRRRLLDTRPGMLMKKIVTLAFCLALPACVAPPIITIASFALSGVSFMQTGKTLPDHALSSVAQRDCKMFRATRGEMICRADTALGLDEPIFLAAAHAGTSWPEEITALPAALAPVSEPMAALFQPVVVASIAPITLPAPVNAPVLSSLSGSAFDQVPGAPPTAAPVDELIPPASAKIRDISVAPKVARQIAAIATREIQLHARGPALEMQQSDSSRHLVVGSFRDRARATAHIARLGDYRLRVLTSEVKGHVQHRVVVGPYPAADLAAAKRYFAARGIKGAWPIKLRETSNGFQTAAR